MFCALPRRRDVSSDEFHDHWRHPHGTLAMQIASVRKYVQSHQLSTPLLGAHQARYEGVVEVWFDCESDAALFPKDPAYSQYLVPDEPRFIDMEGIRYVFTDEEILMSGAGPSDELDDADRAWREANRATSIKIIQLVEADSDIPWASEQDLALGRQIGALRHSRCRPNGILHAEGAAFLGIRELWWPTVSAFTAGLKRAPDAWHALMSRPVRETILLAQAERFI